MTGEDPQQLVRIREGAYGIADLREGMLRLIVINGEFEPEFFDITDALLCRGGHFLDVGANHGLLSFGLASRWADCVTFHLFEPNPNLLSSIERSRQLYPRMQSFLNAFAVSDVNGNVQIEFNESHTGESHVTAEGGTPVECRRLDDYLTDHEISEVALVKIDVEGFELSALRGLSRALEAQSVKAIYFEYCEPWLRRHHDPVELIEFLESHSYQVFYCRPNDLSRYCDRRFQYRLLDETPAILLAPVRGTQLPEATDLLAIPQRLLVHAADQS